MDKILQWSIALQSGDQETLKKLGAPDPKMLQQLFGGPDEPTLMKQAITVVVNPDSELEAKEIAFDNFEMLIENMDNANNIENIKLWSPIIDQLDASKPESLRVYAASIIGTAVQNNPNSQEAFIKYPGLQALIDIASDPATSSELLLKALFAIASFVRNYEAGYLKFDELDGWKIINLSRDSNHKVKLRILSLISSILSTGIDAKKEEHISKAHMTEFLASVLAKDGHAGCIDKVLNIISQLAELKYQFSASEIATFSQGLSNVEHMEELSTDDLHAAKKVIN
ncbi:Hsp70 nucleotide exchange factor FES1 [Suhomyces tanzawaensis NRRL Y-17324]|uniref:Hsp70 nucleotide exchange factor FES1 n=1 Tax=Suhomyces tanzawaensis NRRL Y-17324 TaxID=984487 RepID=A0A1E4SQM6_9ASCO|nr:Hsp70 nucleotide exchange factor FES1 [Suhomyces tanzawaensis NRRL Y-17324]ODV81814.1 Hsp70 nucleotide exchange factor FES1 [Suhomyces tanzawaensis NRRL Y-17324]